MRVRIVSAGVSEPDGHQPRCWSAVDGERRAAPPELGPDFESCFPGRWNPNRSFFPGVRPLAEATACALAAAGWWQPASGAEVEGGLVVATDLQAAAPAARFGRNLAAGGRGSGPTDFLFSLPSSAAAVCGMLYGLSEYQATIVMHGVSGFAAIAAAADRIALGRSRRMVAAALTAHGDGPFGLAVALCLEAGPAASGWLLGEVRLADVAVPPCVPSEEIDGEALANHDWPSSGTGGADPDEKSKTEHRTSNIELRHLAAPSLLPLAVRIALTPTAGGRTRYHVHECAFGISGRIDLVRAEEANR